MLLADVRDQLRVAFDRLTQHADEHFFAGNAAAADVVDAGARARLVAQHMDAGEVGCRHQKMRLVHAVQVEPDPLVEATQGTEHAL